MPIGYYGLAWSAYSNVIGRGFEVEFEKNAMMDIKFVARKPGSRLLSGELRHFAAKPRSPDA